MPRMPKYLKMEWAFFLDEHSRKSCVENVKSAASRASEPP